MRQALTKIAVALALALASPARGDNPPAEAEAPIARARRLIQAGDRPAAVTLLEDTLIDGPAADRPAALDLLRRSYEAMAREAEAAGRADDAARYRDNLAILARAGEADRSRPAPATTPEAPRSPPKTPARSAPRTPARPAARAAAPVVKPTPAPTGRTEKPKVDEPVTTPDEAIPEPPVRVDPPPPFQPPVLRAPKLDPIAGDPSLGEPAALPEPPRLPVPGPVPQGPSGSSGQGMTRVPRSTAPIGSATEGTGEVPTTPPPGLDRPAEPDELDPREAMTNPGAAVGEVAPQSPAPAGPRADAAIAARVPASRTPAPMTAAPAPSGLDEADRLFVAGRWDESGRIYAAMAARNNLPAERRPHWAYCRYKAVVRRINERPRSNREWDEIEGEIRNIQRLTPGLWYGDYLTNKVAEIRKAKRRPAAADGMVVRGSAPDEPSPQIRQQPQAPPPQPPARRRLFGRSRGTETAEPPAQDANPAEGLPPLPASDQLSLPGDPARPDAIDRPGDDPKAGPAPANVGGEATSRLDDARQAPSGGEPGDAAAIAWQVHETPNFRIYHCDPALADRAAAVAEAVRTAQARRWGSTATREAWSPRCELYLYPTAKSYAQATGQPEQSPGLSTMSNNGGRVLSRRMSLRVDNPLLLTSTLPHEVTHIVLADLFVVRTIPRWADEGLAVLAEPAAEQHLRQADLKDPLDAGRVFKVRRLMTMDYPDPRDWRLFYAQSVSLTVFLVEQGPPERFIQFVRDSQRIGTEAALRDIYHIDGLDSLHERWLAYAREHIAEHVASSREPETAPDGIRRE